MAFLQPFRYMSSFCAHWQKNSIFCGSDHLFLLPLQYSCYYHWRGGGGPCDRVKWILYKANMHMNRFHSDELSSLFYLIFLFKLMFRVAQSSRWFSYGIWEWFTESLTPTGYSFSTCCFILVLNTGLLALPFQHFTRMLLLLSTDARCPLTAANTFPFRNLPTLPLCPFSTVTAYTLSLHT
jgi:hypothetical protein